jgi:gamma-glutamylcyclotransferase (GGCT)/AIG2-like uncharacterized protein YtfP
LILPLFAYGTLRDPEYQRELFARTYPMRRARVEGFIVVSTGGGYLAAIPRTGGIIDGALVELDAPGYAIADAWEDRTIYDRVSVEARVESGRIVPAYLYVQLAARGEPVTDGRLADRARADVIADIRAFRAAADFTPQP